MPYQVKAWFMVDSSENPKEMCHYDIPRLVSADYLASIGVRFEKISVDEGIDKVIEYGKKIGYECHDIVTINENIENYDEKLKCFYTEHLHTDDEIRICLDGSAYFDVRDKDNQWIRLKFTVGDLIVLPAGIYHRFTVDLSNNVKALRLFKSNPSWQAYNRDEQVDSMKIRSEYLARINSR
ncbi:1,2-dihydroxy-3-keto-5-methylthiopentene dioxygenase [Strongyloides ratti]|uniref:Acireductone dioxygenase n=1 Tax=Strongyloides ratti TaxID=34506 RepID=A0A090L623_STRRB|nr:1,2-dihydroxy-3-keto-5-methylthiopentene dioxygenase [Strongyloides ratti]CEF63578.1 1,2-dihydroxy-3-keto-5-methylthiopentene dioxygenase [Strongyloides ratti]